MKLFKCLVFLCKKKLVPTQIVSEETPVIIAKCGHPLSSRSITVTIFGHEEKYTLPEKVTNPPLCFNCLIKEAVPCAYCGLAIVPGEPVTLLTPNMWTFVPKPGSLSLRERPTEIVGCWRCAGGPEVLSGAVLRPGKELETDRWFKFEGQRVEPKRLKCVAA